MPDELDMAFEAWHATQNGHRTTDNQPSDDDYIASLEYLDDPGAPSTNGHKPRRINSRERDIEEEEGDTLHESWTPIDLSIVLSGNYQQPMPDWLLRDDGLALLYPGSVNGIHGDSGAGKGWIVSYLIAECSRRGRRCMMLDYEDNEVSLTARLMLLGMSPQQILDTLIYIRPQVAFGPRAVTHLCEEITNLGTAVTVIDSLGEAFATESLDENKDVEVGPWYRRVARPLSETGTALTIIDHATKAADGSLYPSGSKRKRAATTGASYLAEALNPFVKGKGGKLVLTCAKDRHGNYRRGEVVGNLVMKYSAGGTCMMNMEAPSLAAATGEPTTVPVILAARSAVRAAKAEADLGHGAISQTVLVGLMKIKGGTDMKKAGIDYATTLGCLTETPGPRNSRLFEYLTDYPDDGTQGAP